MSRALQTYTDFYDSIIFQEVISKIQEKMFHLYSMLFFIIYFDSSIEWTEIEIFSFYFFIVIPPKIHFNAADGL